ncbi:MAG TPA: nucleoside triphosphate pyrophosphohydrolase [Planctomycetaceae bacterium]|nr:nucleoside triphosphate pyrophosphohydrolase [Planctomycetaceae bacterium]
MNPASTEHQAERVPGTPPPREQITAEFWRLVEVVARLRAPDGCPWDREQTLESIRPFTLEETYEVLEAIDAGDDAALSEELGDLLLQVILYAQIAADEGRFDLVPVLSGLTEKLIRRHPHVFGEEQAHSSDQVIRNWDRVKQQEKPRKSALDGIPSALPALARAARLAAKSTRAGLKWPSPSEVLAAVEAGAAQLRARIEHGESGGALEPAFGRLLFQLAQTAEAAGVNPEDALRAFGGRFEQSFPKHEAELKSNAENSRELAQKLIDEATAG